MISRSVNDLKNKENLMDRVALNNSSYSQQFDERNDGEQLLMKNNKQSKVASEDIPRQESLSYEVKGDDCNPSLDNNYDMGQQSSLNSSAISNNSGSAFGNYSFHKASQAAI